MSTEATAGRRRSHAPLIVGGILFIAAAGFLGWWLTRGDELATLHGHDGPVRAVAFSPDGSVIASAGDDGNINIWDYGTFKKRRSLNIEAIRKVRAIVFGPGTTLFAVGDDRCVLVWDWATGIGSNFLFTGGQKGLECVGISPDGKTVAAGGIDGTVYLWQTDGQHRDRLRSLQGHTKHVHGLAFLPDGKTLLSAGEDGSLRLWNWQDSTTEATIEVGKRHVHGIAVSADGKMVAAAVGGTGLRRWSLPDRRELPAIEGAGMARGVAISPDGKTLATVHEDGTVKLWDNDTGDRRAVLKGHVKVVLGVAFAPDGKTLATAGSDGTVKLWKVADKR
jgi:WD40 repeat protein